MQPSQGDVDITNYISHAARMLEINVVDHIIIVAHAVQFCKARPLMSAQADQQLIEELYRTMDLLRAMQGDIAKILCREQKTKPKQTNRIMVANSTTRNVDPANTC